MRTFLSLLATTAIVTTVFSSHVQAAAGDIYETDFSSGTIFKFNPSGARTTFATGLSGPEGMAFDRSGNFFVTDTGSGRIFKYAPNGTRTIFASGLNGPASLAFDNAGNLFNADFFGNTIFRFTPTGTRTTFAPGLNGPASLAFDTSGRLLVADFHSGTIFRYNANGTRAIFASGLNQPHGLAFDSAGNLFEADFGSGRIYRFTASGARTIFASGLQGPHGLAFDSAGNLFEADYNGAALYKFAPNGARTTFASGLRNPGSVVVDRSTPSSNNLLNLSTRAFIGTNTGVLIAGFILQGSHPATLVLRGIGPSLASNGISNALVDPVIELHDGSGNLLATNNNWAQASNAAVIRTSGLAPSDARESALLVTLNAGNYSVVMHGVNDIQGIGLIELYDLQQTTARAANISSRGLVLTGDNVMIAGFILGGTQGKQIILRALGPSLRNSGINDFLADPEIQLVNANGAIVASNDDWQQSPNATAIRNLGFAPGSPSEAAILVTLNPSSYTAIVRGGVQDTGVALVEVYDLSPAPQ
jgi:sugar lactone lactonase YvrE